MQQQFKQLAGIVLRWSFFFLAIAIFMISCRQKGTVVIPVPEDTSALSKINHFISLDQIKVYQAAFNNERDTLLRLRPGLSLPLSEAFNKQAILEILKNPVCVGIRVSYGIKQTGINNELRLIITGVDTQGNDLYIMGEEASDTANRSAKALQAGPPPPGTSVKGGVEQGQCVPPCR
jgi:hypothetical protein